MGKRASVEEAQLLLHLYDLRREAEMRKARDWWMWQFTPRTADDFLKVAYAAGTQENNWMRQVASYWGLAASFVLQGVLSEELFLRPAFSGEMFFVLAKVHPFLPELREKLGDPEVFSRYREGGDEYEMGTGAVEVHLEEDRDVSREGGEGKAVNGDG